MKLKLAAIALCSALSLGGCATSGGSGGGITTTNITTAISSVQAAAVKICGFLPTAATVSGIVATFIPGGNAIEQLVASVAAQICAAVAPKAPPGLTLFAIPAPQPTVNGVVVHGRQVKPWHS